MTTAQHRLSGSGRSPGGFWPGRHRGMTLVLAVLVVAALAAGIVLALSGGGQPASPAHAGGPALAPVTKGAKWVTGPASRLVRNVNTDQGKFNAAYRAGRPDAARAAGTQLAADAKAALTGPQPPADAALYRSALTTFERAGADAAAGNFRSASTLLGSGNSAMTKVTAAMNLPAPASEPAQVTESNG